MGLPLYLAMTAEEIAVWPPPRRLAYMACHFAPYGSGLYDLPTSLPPDSMLMVDDRVPVWQHDPGEVTRQLKDAVTRLRCSRVLLDFQQPNSPQAAKIARAVVEGLSCPVGVSQTYARELECPVFVCAPKANKPLSSCLVPWEGRKIWLEAAVETRTVTVTKEGAQAEDGPLIPMESPIQKDERLCCSYHIDVTQDQVRFTVSRTREDVARLLAAGEEAGAELAVGLYQQLGTR